METEELLVGDEIGNVYLYAVEWPNQDQRDLFDWHGSMTLLARISCHNQQVCGMAWSSDGHFFTTGGNDNSLYLFEAKKILRKPKEQPQPGRARGNSDATVNVRSGAGRLAGQDEVLIITPGQHKHLFTLNAAVKAIAFAPWQSSLLAAGGGSNDRCIHFFHTLSGSALATIDCHAQVTSLIWGEKRREIAATFGFAQPEHAVRVAVFAWPSCKLIVAIPWVGEERALYAVSYPSLPAGSTTQEAGEGRKEGCLVVATSDASIKFHEVWSGLNRKGGSNGNGGWLGGSQILEGTLAMERHPAIR